MLLSFNKRFATGLVAACALASFEIASAQTNDRIAAPITVRASRDATEKAAGEFLTNFLTTAIRLNGSKFIASLTTAVQLRPDLAPKIVVCALNISRLNLQTTRRRLPLVKIEQIVKAAVSAAPQAAAAIVRAAIESEPYARGAIVAAAISAAPAEAAEIVSAAAQTEPISTFAGAALSLNPVDNAGSGNVVSPEKPPAGP